MHSIDHSQAINGALFSFGAGLVLSGFNPFPLALFAGLSATVASISSDIFAKMGKEKKLGMSSTFLLISASSLVFFTTSGVAALLPLEGVLGMAFAGVAFSSWLIIRKWSELYAE